MVSQWLEAVQTVTGGAAVAAIVVSLRSVRTVRRTPLANAYLQAWDQVVEVVVTAAYTGPDSVTRDVADDLMKRFRAADHRLNALEAGLGVKAYRGDRIRSQVNNLLVVALYADDPGRHSDGTFPADIRPGWADPGSWPQLGRSTIASVLASDDVLFELPECPWDYDLAVLRLFAPRLLRDLDADSSVYCVHTETQYQLARLLDDFHRELLEPFITKSTREALTGRYGLPGLRIRVYLLVHRSRLGLHLVRIRNRHRPPTDPATIQ